MIYPHYQSFRMAEYIRQIYQLCPSPRSLQMETQKPLRSLSPDDRVRAFSPASGTWTPGIVQHVADTPRSYLVATEKGGTLRSNRCHLRATGESLQF